MYFEIIGQNATFMPFCKQLTNRWLANWPILGSWS